MDPSGSASRASEGGSQLADGQTSQADSPFQWAHVKHLIETGSTEQLSKGVATASGLLTEFEKILGNFGDNQDVVELIDAMVDLQKQAEHRGAVVGVVGSTGAGKSSIINAVLDEESLVPTSGMRACTAAITEISWNNDEDPAKLYKAEVEFIKAEDWEQELRILFNDLADLVGLNGQTSNDQTSNGQTPNGQTLEDMADANSQTGIILAKVRTVYPALKDDDFRKGAAIVDDLLKDKNVNDVLGTTMLFYADTASAILEQLQPYIDSKEKNRGDQTSQDDETTMSTWPLAKVVRIYTKAPVLQSGLVLVDLPGVHDSNAARAAMAEEYMKQCNAIWVVAPITRAVDDKSAQKLMSTTFQRQMQLDGQYGNLTMICSKADDISVTEMTRNIQADQQYRRKLADIDAEITGSKELLEQKREALNTKEKCLKECESIQKMNAKRIAELASALGTSKGEEVLVSPGKRPLDHPTLPKPKRRLGEVSETEDADSDDSDDEDSDSDPEKSDPNPAGGVCMSKADVMMQIDDLNKQNKTQKEIKRALKREQKSLNKEVKALEKAHEAMLKDKKRGLCIQFRNNYLRKAVKTKFKQSLKELEQDDFVGDDNDDVDLVQSVNNHDTLARDLPVFCVSARAYMKLTGKFSEDEAVRGFETVWDTDIPDLQQHALAIADEFRSAVCRRILEQFLHIMRTLEFQLLMEEKPLELEKELRDRELDHLTASWNKLKHGLEAAEREFRECTDDIQKKISDKLEYGARVAKLRAEEVMTDWFKKRTKGGIAYMTFAAACRRQGRYDKGDVDLNEDLVQAMKKVLARRWQNVFNERIPSAIDTFARTTTTHLAEFRAGVESRRHLQRSAKTLRALTDLIRSFEKGIGETEIRKKFVATGQQIANRAMTPVIKEAMGPTYGACLQHTGSGCYGRIEALVFAAVKREERMFDLAGQAVCSELQKVFAKMEGINHKYISQGLGKLERKCKNMVQGTKIFASLKEAGDQLRCLLDEADSRFEIVCPADDIQMTDVVDAQMPDVTDDEMTDVADNHHEGVGQPRVNIARNDENVRPGAARDPRGHESKQRT